MKKERIFGIAVIVSIVLIICFFAFFPTAKIRINSKEIKLASDKIDVNIKMPVISGLSDRGLQIELNHEILSYLSEMKETMVLEAATFSNTAKKDNIPFRPFQLVSTFKVTRADDRILSFYIDTYAFTGGAHGMTYRRPYNISLKDGKMITLKDVFKGTPNYIEKVNARIDEQISKNPDVFFTDEKMRFKTILDDQPFYILPGAIVIYFNLYEIAPYSSGLPEFTIEVPSLR